jgi:hypothetical protein
MAIPSGLCCQIRALVMHVYPDGIKEYGHERHTVPLGRRGKPVEKVRFIPAEKAHALALKLQGRFGTTVSVLRGLGPRPAGIPGRSPLARRSVTSKRMRSS